MSRDDAGFCADHTCRKLSGHWYIKGGKSLVLHIELDSSQTAKSTIMKVLIFFTLVAVSQAAVLVHHPAVLNTGASTQFRNQDNFGNYAFGYDEGHLSGGTFRRESGDAHGNVAGSYGLRDADGRVRVVNYVADAAGFRADIKTNEPGVEPKDPAHTAINKAGLVVAPAHHAVAYAAPAHHALAYAAPVPVAHAPVAYAAHHVAAPHYGYAYHY